MQAFQKCLSTEDELMNTKGVTRRELLLAAAAGVVEPAILGAERSAAAAQIEPNPAGARALHVVCVGAHPDDPESGCGGTLAKCAAAGHRVSVIYLTRGEAGIAGKSHDEAAAIRTAEAEAACTVLGAKPLFAGQIDGATEANQQARSRFANCSSRRSPTSSSLIGRWTPIPTTPWPAF